MSLFSGVMVKAIGITVQNFVHFWVFVLYLRALTGHVFIIMKLW